MKLPKSDLPTYEIELPSNGKKVKMRPFTVKERKNLLMVLEGDAKEMDIINAIEQLIENCVDDVNVNEIPGFDLEWVFLNLRAKSIGDVETLNYTCKNDRDGKLCNTSITTTYNILETKLVTFPDHNPKIMFSENLGVMMKYPNLKGIKEINESSNLGVDLALEFISKSIDYIFDKDNMYYAKDSTVEELKEFLEGLQLSAFEKVEQFFQTIPRYSQELNIVCPKCKHVHNVTIEGIESFFE